MKKHTNVLEKLKNVNESEMLKKPKYRIRTQLDFGQIYQGVANSGEILTVPDQSYTIEEILDRFTRGIALDINRNGQYSDTDSFDDVDERSYLNDLTDMDEVQGSMAARRERRKPKTDMQPAPTTKLAEESNPVE